MNRRILITVSPIGETVVKPQGYAGSECYSPQIVNLEQALGLRLKPKVTNEYFQEQQETCHESIESN